MQATGQGDSFADQMSDAALAASVVAIGTKPIGQCHQNKASPTKPLRFSGEFGSILAS
jgi:hypothetical protein